jgi:dGTP triphosphohydrolase
MIKFIKFIKTILQKKSKEEGKKEIQQKYKWYRNDIHRHKHNKVSPEKQIEDIFNGIIASIRYLSLEQLCDSPWFWNSVALKQGIHDKKRCDKLKIVLHHIVHKWIMRMYDIQTLQQNSYHANTDILVKYVKFINELYADIK